MIHIMCESRLRQQPETNQKDTNMPMSQMKDRIRTALQAPISSTKMCVIYRKEGREIRSPWFYREDHARKALSIMQKKYGESNAILYLD